MAAGLGTGEVWPHSDCPRASPEAVPGAAGLSCQPQRHTLKNPILQVLKQVIYSDPQSDHVMS